MIDADNIGHVMQPDDYSCACAVAAMLLDRPLAELVAEMRPSPRTGVPHRRLIAALRAGGLRVEDRFKSIHARPLPDVAVVRVTWGDRRVGHVVLKVQRRWFDPLLARPFTGMPPDAVVTSRNIVPWSGGGRITSSLEVRDALERCP